MPSLERRLFRFSASAHRLLHAGVACRVIATLLLVAQLVVLSKAIADVFLHDAGQRQIAVEVLVMLGLAGGRAVLVGAAEVLEQRSASMMSSALRSALLKHLSALGIPFIQRERSGHLVSAAVQGLDDLEEYVVRYLPQKYLAVTVPIAVAIAVAIIDPLSLLVLLFTGPLLVLFLVLIGSRAKELTDRRFRELSLLSSNFLDLLHGLPTLKMFGRSKEQVANIQAVGRQYGATTMTVLRTAFETTFVLELSTTVATAIVAVEVGLRLTHGSIAFQPALAVLMLTPEFFAPIRQLALRYHAGAAGSAAADAIFTIMDAPLPQSAIRPRVVDWRQAALPAIRLENVGFSYEAGHPTLDGLSFEIPPGTTTAIVGESGAGKTTIVNLLLRFIEPQTGAILANGVPLTSIDVARWRDTVAWVPQRPYLFSGTVAENLRLAKPDATWHELASAAREAGAHGFIQDLPQGYDTPLGENGVGLSGGERQRLAIARAFLKDAAFLILDEPTSHLEAGDEALIRGALGRLGEGRTVLLVTHRLALIEDAHHVVVLKDGRIVARGTPQEVLSGIGAPRHLVTPFPRPAA